MLSKLLLSLAILVGSLSSLSAQVVISQVYGGGGNSGATLRNDFIEIFNRGNTMVSLSGYSVQYASSTGTTWQVTNLVGILAPGQYYLVQESAGTGGTTNLPTPDVSGSIAMSAAAGKVALVNSQTALSGACPSNVVDLLGYGPGTNCAEGSPTTANLTNTTAALRASGGCTDTNNNSADFSNGAPNPRNTGSTLNVCGASPLMISTSGTLGATVNVPFSAALTATGGSGSGYTFSVAQGSTLPGFLSINGSTLSGTPTSTAGSPYSFTLQVSDSVNATATKAFTLTVGQPGCTVTALISQIQGSGNTSPLTGQTVTTRGIVTARRSNGYFLQSADANADADPNTSEGVFVFTSSAPPSAASVGNDVCVSATVSEFIPTTDANSPSVTELVSATTALLATGNALPAPVVIAPGTLTTNGGLYQLERYEGMRVQVNALNVIAATGGTITEPSATVTSNAVFYGVLPGTARPFREPGVELPDPLPSGSPANVPRFDGNPEKIRVDGDGQVGVTFPDVSVGATVGPLVGPLDYSFRSYTILPDASPVPVISNNNLTFTPAPDATPNEFTVASFNMERFFDTVNDPATSDPVLTPTAFAGRLQKASRVIRQVMRMPDVIGVEEMENLTTLQAVATQVNNDAVANSQPNPGYVAFLFEGNDVGGIDVGFLVKSRVTVNSVTQFGLSTTYTEPAGASAILNDRPPLVMDATISGSNFQIIVNHLRSLGNIDDPADGNRVRTKRRAQAEFLANLIQSLQTANPNAKIVSVGDYNAFQVNDGYVDVIGTIKGTPAPADQVVLASPALVNPTLTDLVDTLPAENRYSYSFDGTAQVLDHIIVNPNAQAVLSRFVYARNDADFPVSLYGDFSRPERISDHDIPIAYFNLPTATEVTGQVTIATIGLSFNRFTNIHTVTLRITNTGGSVLAGPFQLRLDNVPSGIALVSPSGTNNGSPYLTISNPGSLAAGDSMNVVFQLSNPARVTVGFSPKLFTGSF